MDPHNTKENKENILKGEREMSPISRLLQNYKGDPIEGFNALSISSPNRDYGPPPISTPCFGSMKPFNPYLT